ERKAMMMPGDSPQKIIDRYLARLRSRLSGISDAARADVVDEIRSHLLDRAAASGSVTADSVAEAVAALGSPEDLARAYVMDETVARPALGPSSWISWARSAVASFLGLGVSVVGYAVAAAFALCALLKPIHPDTAGLWLLPSPGDSDLSLRMGFGAPPAGGHELLGWWIIPLGAMVALGIVIATARIGRLRAP